MLPSVSMIRGGAGGAVVVVVLVVVLVVVVGSAAVVVVSSGATWRGVSVVVTGSATSVPLEQLATNRPRAAHTALTRRRRGVRLGIHTVWRFLRVESSRAPVCEHPPPISNTLQCAPVC